MKKIKVTYFFSDEENYEFFRSNHIGYWQKFANRFFKKYDLELDSVPYPYNSKAWERDFILSRQNYGIKPTEKNPDTDKILREIEELDRKANEALRNNVPLANSLMEEMQKKLKEVEAFLADNLSFRLDFVRLRLQCNKDFIGNRPTVYSSLRGKNHYILVPRLAIIFCDFIRVRPAGGGTIGYTVSPSTDILALYPHINTFIIISREGGMGTLTHEICHAITGHVHPSNFPLDGTENSIFNYENDYFEPEDLTLGSSVKYPGFSETQEERLKKIAHLSEFVI
jgi:hypothetical protein